MIVKVSIRQVTESSVHSQLEHLTTDSVAYSRKLGTAVTLATVI